MAPKRQRTGPASKGDGSKQVINPKPEHQPEANIPGDNAPSTSIPLPCSLDLPPPPPLLPPWRPPALSESAKARCQSASELNAVTCPQLLGQFQRDDTMAEIASCRGLLVRFRIASAYNSLPSESATLLVEAPELADVLYLKRRVVKAKLMLGGHLLLPQNFDLKQCDSEQSEDTQPLDETKYLFELGYRAGETHDVGIMSRSNPAITTAHHVEQVIPQRDLGFGPKSDIVAVRRYQDLLENARHVGAAATGQVSIVNTGPAGSAGLNGAHHMLRRASKPVISAPPASAGVSSPNALVATAASPNGLTPRTAPPPGAPSAPSPLGNGGVGDATQIQLSPRVQRAGRWQPEEVQALVGGVQAYGLSAWSKIHEMYSGRGIDRARTSVDYKDKWRNLLKAAQNPRQTARGAVLSDELRTLVLRLAMPLASAAAPQSPGRHAIAQAQQAQAQQQRHAEALAAVMGVTSAAGGISPVQIPQFQQLQMEQQNHHRQQQQQQPQQQQQQQP